MKERTHLQIDKDLCGTPIKIEQDYSLVRLQATEAMEVDDHGLIHGGFIFGVADYAAMLAVNDPKVVLGAASVSFTRPVKASQTVEAEAKVVDSQGKKRIVAVSATVDGREVFKGTLTCYVLEKHVLEGK